MKEGDIIEWKGVNSIHRGRVIKSDTDTEGFLVKLDNGCTFPLKALRRSRSAKLIEI